LWLSIQAFDEKYIFMKQMVRLIKNMRLTVELGADCAGFFGDFQARKRGEGNVKNLLRCGENGD